MLNLSLLTKPLTTLNATGQVKVADFGISRAVDNTLAQAHTHTGTGPFPLPHTRTYLLHLHTTHDMIFRLHELVFRNTQHTHVHARTCIHTRAQTHSATHLRLAACQNATCVNALCARSSNHMRRRSYTRTHAHTVHSTHSAQNTRSRVRRSNHAHTPP